MITNQNLDNKIWGMLIVQYCITTECSYSMQQQWGKKQNEKCK